MPKDLFDLQSSLGGVTGDSQARTVLHFGDVTGEYQAARSGAVCVDRSNRGKLRFSGEDRNSFLHGMLTNTVNGLSEGEGNHSSLTDAKGNTQADLWVFNVGNTLVIETEPNLQEAVAAFLDRYIIADDVEIKDQTGEYSIIGVQGPEAPQVVRGILDTLPEIDTLGVVSPPQNVHGVEMVTKRSYTGANGYDLWVQADRAGSLFESVVAAGAKPAGEAALEMLRIESGIPSYGKDIDDRVVPLEAGIDDAVDFAKGCFIGQEVLAKMHNLGKPRRYLVGLYTDSLVAGSELLSGDKVVGDVKSGVHSNALNRVIHLASVRRGFETPGTELSLKDGGIAEVVALPFRDG